MECTICHEEITKQNDSPIEGVCDCCEAKGVTHEEL